MSLQISEIQGVFHAIGTLDRNNAQELSQHFTKYFKSAQRVVLNLEQIVEFDSHAAYALMKMYIKAVHGNSKFSIVGMKNKKLLHVLQETETMTIWYQTRSLK